jgi:predicted alpha/beta-fold hydrolase
MRDSFTPLPFFRSGHRQTLLGYALRKMQRPLAATLQRVTLPDGDVLHLYDSIPQRWKPSDAIALIVHGLGGCHNSGSVLQLSKVCLKQGMRIVRINLRGSGESLAENKKPYHAGCSTDIVEVVKTVAGWSPESPLYLMGLSLGGNVVLKLAVENSQKELPTLKKIIAVSPPVDLERCSTLLGQPHNKLYEKRFVQELSDYAIQRARLHHEPALVFPPGMKLREFDDIYTAPRVGYGTVGNYYSQASTAPLLHRIEIPTHILSSEDDPMIDPEPIRNSPRSAAVSVQLTSHGGHLGYVSRLQKGTWCWMEQYVVSQLNTNPKR